MLVDEGFVRCFAGLMNVLNGGGAPAQGRVIILFKVEIALYGCEEFFNLVQAADAVPARVRNSDSACK